MSWISLFLAEKVSKAWTKNKQSKYFRNRIVLKKSHFKIENRRSFGLCEHANHVKAHY